MNNPNEFFNVAFIAFDALTVAVNNIEDDNRKPNNLHSSLGEVTSLAGNTYQIQMSLISDRKLWIDKDSVSEVEVIRIHK